MLGMGMYWISLALACYILYKYSRISRLVLGNYRTLIFGQKIYIVYSFLVQGILLFGMDRGILDSTLQLPLFLHLFTFEDGVCLSWFVFSMTALEEIFRYEDAYMDARR